MNKTVQEIQADKQATNLVIFHNALLKLHGDIEKMKKTEGNTFFPKHKYIPLPDMLRALKPVIQKHGFILTQGVDVGSNAQIGMKNIVSSRVIHAATGLSQDSRLALPDLNDMQKLGGAITYARRYTLSALLSIEEIDDDGNTAVGNRVKSGVKVKDKF